MEKWWKETVFYEIYMPSFKDGNGDGIGDFIGLTNKLDYLSELGIGAIWLTPFYQSPRIDNGYDISDYYSIDPIFGSDEDLERFIEEAHKRNIRVIADLVINHTSTEHQWFKESASSRDSAKRDWYIWKDTPNNWESFFGGSAWEYDQRTEQYYYHSFAKEQADLNWRNPEVKQEIFKVIEYWLLKGFDGFRLDVINNLTLGETFPDNPTDENGEQIHLMDKDQEGIRDILSEINAFIKKINPKAFTVGEISSDDLETIAKYSEDNILDVTFNFNFGSVEAFKVEKVFNELKRMDDIYQSDRDPTLFFGSHDMGRLWSRLANGNIGQAELLATLILTAKGVPFLYFGDEIGMEDLVQHSIEEFRDIQAIMSYRLALENGEDIQEAIMKANKASRDKARAPMQWENEPFSPVEPWIPEAKRVDGRGQRLFSFYKKLIRLREIDDFCYAPYKHLEIVNNLIYYQRGNCLFFLNFGEESETVENDWEIDGMLLSNVSPKWTQSEIEIPEHAAVILAVN
ncbi:alpha-glucosidase [Bacillus timonensis]|uniref:Alpha-glucosidase n=1 Tax=Bacillus timonensis TaxID=1033734 RepID=A0A4S3PW38_9BACI|nr:alpha-glucosidase [Bacillus timonensis]THE13938.1 alpha-glucosidase [Bacillus timonensis]